VGCPRVSPFLYIIESVNRKNFIKHDEDFVCENCGHQMAGTGFTNHCSKCLYSKHVDNVPGDRANRCDGMMEPVDLEMKQGLPHQIVHKCLRCQEIKNNKVSEDDNLDILLNASR